MNGDDKGWIEGARLTLVAVVSAVVAATLVIQIGSAVRDGAAVRAESRIILTAH
ncbi:MAG: hypothetical protein KJ676_07425 [Alphaproteobacteria bacterium]|nr:hypothetical protein [Alphaproteobacteria bacterium]MBU1525241.1 hypothetical protein [Alphaproteobacteria bacterium]MBU2116489.1 hypothetical protein [Alphaproteobacteria bacterium]MBU2351205.1 hypothetical protein [Alphaproteobacteria bacterium]MBU2382665.1 hypothetical protein [Alphaproteobacteria bacterium]